MEIQWEKTTCQQTGIGFVCLTSKRQPNKWDNICVALNTIIIVKRSRSFFSTSFYCTVWVYTFRWFFPSSWRIFFPEIFFSTYFGKTAQMLLHCMTDERETEKCATFYIIYIFQCLWIYWTSFRLFWDHFLSFVFFSLFFFWVE